MSLLINANKVFSTRCYTVQYELGQVRQVEEGISFRATIITSYEF